MDKQEIIDLLNKKLKYCQNRLETLYPKGLADEKLNKHGGWGVGYWEGKIGLIEALLDDITNK